jgi:hypothetical protein
MGAAPSALPEKSVVQTLDERLRSMHVADNDYLFVEKHLGEYIELFKLTTHLTEISRRSKIFSR